MHSEGVFHRDLKLQNILMVSHDHNDWKINVSDFGFACHIQDFDETVFPGTPYYKAPELILKQQYNEKVDIWTIGVIAYQLLAKGNFPYNQSPSKVDSAICNDPFDIESISEVSPNGKEFIMAALTKDAKMRPSAAELLKFPWITEHHSSVEGKLDSPRMQNLVLNAHCFAKQNKFQKMVYGILTGIKNDKVLDKELA